MNRSERLSYPAAEALGDALAAVRVRVQKVFAAYVELRSKATAIRELERLSEHTLKDIGLHRSEIRAAVSGQRMPWS